MEQSFELGMIWAIVKRRYLYFIVPFVMVFAAAIAIAYALPRSYEAKATILIESQRIPSELASTTVTASSSERIKVIEQRLFGRDNLLSIANKFSLYNTHGKRNKSPTEIVEDMRNTIEIKQIGAATSRRNTRIIGFDVTFRYSDATLAARVTNELVNSILSQNLETRLSRAAETSEFFQQQLRNLESELLEIENRIAAYKRDHEAALPDTLGIRREKLTELVGNIDVLTQQISLAEQAGDNPAATGDAKSQQLDFRLQAAELNYDAFIERRELLAPLLEKGFVSQRTMDDLDRQIKLAEIEIASIRSRMSQDGITADPDTRLKLLQSQKAEFERRAEELQKSIARTPSVEVELAAMVRDHENLRAQYGLTKAKLTDAEIGEKLEQDRQAERFEVLEQATTPQKPAKPDRIHIVAAGGAGAIALGLGLVVLLEFLDKSVRTASDLERRLQLRPIAVIPYVATKQERYRRFAKRALTICIMLAAIVGALVATHLFVTPLDLFAERVWQKIQPLLPSILMS
ncbi:uncharacterized protein involved in exopolysaccharide biosynthesis [Labrenzia sp. EL_126]|nr:uncharacterized protein involved in exopolysaccharide biosynthesis [Labrenzia sp. EL_126]